MRLLVLVLGICAALLGGLWLVQGLGLVHIEPILCFANCEPVQGASAEWAMVGLVVAAAGALAIAYTLMRPRDGDHKG